MCTMKTCFSQFTLGLLSLFAAIFLSCSTTGSYEPGDASGTLDLALQPVRINGPLLPGGYFSVVGANLVPEASYQARLDLNLLDGLQSIDLEVQGIDGGELILRLPVAEGQRLAEGQTLGSLLISAQLREFSGVVRTEWSAEIRHQITPELSLLSDTMSPQTLSAVSGTGFLLNGEGESILNLTGQLTRLDGTTQVIELSSPLLLTATEATDSSLSTRDRSTRWWIPLPQLFGVKEGRFEGTAIVTNGSATGLAMSNPISVAFDYLPPYVSFMTPDAISRGQLITIGGGGFIDILEGGEVGITSISLNGRLTPFDRQLPPIDIVDQRLDTRRQDGRVLTTTFDPVFNSSCESNDLGGVSGVFEGELRLTTFWRDQEQLATLPISFQVIPSKQVVYLSFLPAFTDSLRLFGLRNVSARVIEEIIEVVRRDYAEVNLDLRTTPPVDFVRYSTVEIGGPDPNARSLFGLDNTTGLDHCNQRLNDDLAGRNAESGNTYGGVFVESFLNLSPRRSSAASGIADPLFDEIFDPVINMPAQQSDLSGPRAEEVNRAIKVLGHLVGNTLTHEIGHSLGLPVVKGCGEYHNPAGPRQIMDCGQDRPFLERAGLDPNGPPIWMEENLAYLKKILPL